MLLPPIKATSDPVGYWKFCCGSIGGGDPAPAWIDDGHCVCDDFCQCNLVGIDASGRSRTINGQDLHHVGELYANSNAIWQRSHRVFKSKCRRSGIKTHHPSNDCNKHTMDVHIAANLIRSVVSMLAGAPPGDPQLVFLKSDRGEVSQKALLPTEGTYSKLRSRWRIEDAWCEVARFLDTCDRIHRSIRRVP